MKKTSFFPQFLSLSTFYHIFFLPKYKRQKKNNNIIFILLRWQNFFFTWLDYDIVCSILLTKRERKKRSDVDFLILICISCQRHSQYKLLKKLLAQHFYAFFHVLAFFFLSHRSYVMCIWFHLIAICCHFKCHRERIIKSKFFYRTVGLI